MSAINRRSAIAALGSLPALSVPAASSPISDAPLRALWAQYLAQVARDKALLERVALSRAAVDAELPPKGKDDRWETFEALSLKHGHRQHYDEWCDGHAEIAETVRQIQQTPAEGVFGIGVKLAAIAPQYEMEDLEELLGAVAVDITRLTRGAIPDKPLVPSMSQHLGFDEDVQS
jgi:hypothetical protein